MTRMIHGSVLYNTNDPLDRGLIAEYRFEYNTGLMLPDYSGYSTHGAVSGAVWTTTPSGPALFFDGNNDYVNIPHREVQRCLDADQPGEISVEAFFRWTTVAAGWKTLVSKPGDINLGDHGWRLTHDNVDPPHVEIAAGASKYRGSAQTLASGVLYHVIGTVVRASNTMHIYVNGVLDDGVLAAGGSWPEASTSPISIGRRGGDNDRYFPGDILLVRIYNRALTAGAVYQRYQICRRRMQTFGGVWSLPNGLAPAAPIGVPILTTYASYSVPVG